MAKCVDCAHYPWKPDADPAALPSQRCHPLLPGKRWTGGAQEQVHDCPLYQPAGEKAKAAEPVQEPVPPSPASTGEQGGAEAAPAATGEGRVAEQGTGGKETEQQGTGQTETGAGTQPVRPQVDPEKLEYHDLKKLAGAMGLDTSGKLPVLLARVKAALATGQ